MRELPLLRSALLRPLALLLLLRLQPRPPLQLLIPRLFLPLLTLGRISGSLPSLSRGSLAHERRLVALLPVDTRARLLLLLHLAGVQMLDRVLKQVLDAQFDKLGPVGNVLVMPALHIDVPSSGCGRRGRRASSSRPRVRTGRASAIGEERQLALMIPHLQRTYTAAKYLRLSLGSGH